MFSKFSFIFVTFFITIDKNNGIVQSTSNRNDINIINVLCNYKGSK